MSYEKDLEKLAYGSPLSDQNDAYENLNEELDRKSPSTLASIVGGVGGSVLGAIPAYGLGRLAGRANKFVPKQARKAFYKYGGERGNPENNFAAFLRGNALEAHNLNKSADDATGLLDKFLYRNMAGSHDALSHPTQMRRAYQDMLGLTSAGFGAMGGSYVGNRLAGQAFGEDNPGTAQARETLSAMQSGKLSAKELEEAKRKLALHFQQTEANQGSRALEALTGMAVGIPLALATKHPAVAEKMAKLIPNEALAKSPIVKSAYGRNALSDFGMDATIAGPIATAAGVGAYKLTEDNDDYSNPF